MRTFTVTFKTEQEKFWAGDFGNEYVHRNDGEDLVSANIAVFSDILKYATDVKSVVELGCNRGLNLRALSRINKNIELCGYEINESAAKIASELNIAEIHNKTIIPPIIVEKKYDLSFTKGVLIHINPDELKNVYQNLYNLSSRYIVVCEYYNPSPVSVSYRGNSDKLFKRDFAGELIDQFDLELVNYGFLYSRDNRFTACDSTWFLLKKYS